MIPKRKLLFKSEVFKIANLPLNEISVKSQFDDGDYFFIIKDGQPYRVSANKLTASGDWNDIQNKPFDDIDLKKLSITSSVSNGKFILQLTLNDNYIQKTVEDIVDEKIKHLSSTGTTVVNKLSLNAAKTTSFTVKSEDMIVIN